MTKKRFTTKLEALQSAVHVWTCSECGMQHRGHKPTECKACSIRSLTSKFNTLPAFFHFDSIGEANRYAELQMLLNHGQITELRLQVPFPVYPGALGTLSISKLGKPVFKYIADFVYRDDMNRKVIEDVKGSTSHVTDLFKLKKKIIEAMYQVDIRLV